jgi:hypothetical protein
MGNRAVITFSENRSTGVGIYLHWNGGLESVLAFLDAAKARGFRDPASDPSYAMARLCGLIHEFFGVRDSCSLGVGLLSSLHTDNWDNGVYVVGKDWAIVDRWGKGSGRGRELADLSGECRVKYDEILTSLV